MLFIAAKIRMFFFLIEVFVDIVVVIVVIVVIDGGFIHHVPKTLMKMEG